MAKIDQLLKIMARLRDPAKGCAWDLQQDFGSIAPYTIEEAYEVADAIEREDYDALKDELGDLLLQPVFHAQMASEAGYFEFDDVVESICNKLVRRHPNVFGDDQVSTAAEQTRAWQRHKALERAQKRDSGASLLDDVPQCLPALSRAHKLQERAAGVGFDWPTVNGAFDKVNEELGELSREMSAGSADKVPSPELVSELGDLLFALVNVARHLGVDAEQAVRHANRKFQQRFEFIERSVATSGSTLEQASLDEMDALWDEAKNTGL